MWACGPDWKTVLKQPPEVSCKKKFEDLKTCKIYWKEAATQVFSVKFTNFQEHLSLQNTSTHCFCNVFVFTEHFEVAWKFSDLNFISRSSCLEVFCERRLLQNPAKFNEKYYCRSLFYLIKLQASSFQLY